MENNKHKKKQIYIWDQNLEFFKNLPNKSKTINLLMIKYRQELENTDGEPAKA